MKLPMYVSESDYKVFASILGDFGEHRGPVRLEDFLKAMKSVGFGRHGAYELVPPPRIGRKLFNLAKGSGKPGKAISDHMQDGWKIELHNLYGWTAETFYTY
ncbi:hypothetical protein BD309DRAFT_1085191 [Dichomitus squalens]|uniref:Uncharacterized protein n=2 Tax=Dichomitus squalens TaxID=114155 RepID=A0A4Q9M431_9APHY|nr:uncharacterized protein DICSQDRAFT_175636 [Dichomitus squalens LYAD-421 SS1]EJF55674.1 hypothetical protein DICSQDRAFT_175636 [Dichomitus squalens LYAD-421 SS1]TBU21535.1 hypothetical protein BD311DRAFT_678118 [Dichomitus squalens]TBU36373.1 hypothetical protein BD309DRAFT_1085191 [Dichomitus squalens]TBU51524.1 hypothetical protein BD310DRAFT_1043514 [Dichomitus squalens]